MAKTKEGRSLGHGRTEKSGDSALSRKQKAEKVSIVFAKKKKKTEHGNDSKDTWEIMRRCN